MSMDWCVIRFTKNKNSIKIYFSDLVNCTFITINVKLAIKFSQSVIVALILCILLLIKHGLGVDGPGEIVN